MRGRSSSTRSGGPPITAERFDLAIVGGGIVGALIALLAREAHPSWKLLLVDRGRLGGGATQLCAGLATRLSHSAAHRKISERSELLYRWLAAELPELSLRYLPLYFVGSTRLRAGLTSTLHGPPPRLVASGERKAVEEACCGLPRESGEILGGGTASCGAAPAMVAEIAARLRVGGVEIREGCEVGAIAAHRDGLGICLAAGDRLAARRAAIAIGPWLLHGQWGGLARRAGVRTKKIVALHIDRRPAPGSPVVYFYEQGAFLLPLEREGYWLFSFRCEEWDCRPEAEALRVTTENWSAGLALLARCAPNLAVHACGSRVSCDAYTPDGVPLVVPDPALPGVVVAGAGSGSGFRLAPGIAAQVLDTLSRTG